MYNFQKERMWHVRMNISNLFEPIFENVVALEKSMVSFRRNFGRQYLIKFTSIFTTKQLDLIMVKFEMLSIVKNLIYVRFKICEIHASCAHQGNVEIK